MVQIRSHVPLVLSVPANGDPRASRRKKNCVRRAGKLASKPGANGKYQKKKAGRPATASERASEASGWSGPPPPSPPTFSSIQAASSPS